MPSARFGSLLAAFVVSLWPVGPCASKAAPLLRLPSVAPPSTRWDYSLADSYEEYRHVTPPRIREYVIPCDPHASEPVHPAPLRHCVTMSAGLSQCKTDAEGQMHVDSVCGVHVPRAPDAPVRSLSGDVVMTPVDLPPRVPDVTFARVAPCSLQNYKSASSRRPHEGPAGGHVFSPASDADDRVVFTWLQRGLFPEWKF